MSTVEAREIQRYLPHGYPLLLVDRVTEIEEGVSGVGVKNVTADEICINGHFPGNPIMPGVLIVECMAQTAAVVFGYRRERPEDGGEGHAANHLSARLGMIQNMKFRKPVVPGDRLTVAVRLVRRFGRTFKISAEARVGDEVVAGGTLILAG